MNKILIQQYKEWNEKITNAFPSRLKRPLITNCFQKFGLLETNIDRLFIKASNLLFTLKNLNGLESTLLKTKYTL